MKATLCGRPSWKMAGSWCLVKSNCSEQLSAPWRRCVYTSNFQQQRKLELVTVEVHTTWQATAQSCASCHLPQLGPSLFLISQTRVDAWSSWWQSTTSTRCPLQVCSVRHAACHLIPWGLVSERSHAPFCSSKADLRRHKRIIGHLLLKQVQVREGQ